MPIRETRWDDCELFKIDAKILDRVKMPGSEKRYLSEVGLPISAPMPVEGSFAILPASGENSTTNSTGGYRLCQAMNKPHYLAVGYFNFNEYFGAHKIFCINQRLGGVYSFDADNYPMRLVNTSVKRFSESLYCYREFVNAGFEIANLHALVKDLRKIDIRAMINTSGYWAMLLDDLSENI